MFKCSMHYISLLWGGVGKSSGPVLWTSSGRNKTLAPSTSLPPMGQIGGVNTASLAKCLHSSKTRARWADGFHDELNGHVFDLESDGLGQVVLCPCVTMRICGVPTTPAVKG